MRLDWPPLYFPPSSATTHVRSNSNLWPLLLIYSIIGGVVVILGLYMLLWGKDKDQEYSANNEHESDLDCEKQEKVIDASAAQNDLDEPKMMK